MYSLPTTINVNGTDYAIRSDFRCVIDIMQALSDPDLSDKEKAEVMLRILYEEFDSMPPADYQEALDKATMFIDMGMPESKQKARLMDWEQDAPIIIPAVNKVAREEVRAAKYLHWWTFLGYFMEIEEGTFSTVLGIRQKKAKHKKLESYEKEFVKSNPDMVELKSKLSQEQQKEVDNLLKWL